MDFKLTFLREQDIWGIQVVVEDTQLIQCTNFLEEGFGYWEPFCLTQFRKEKLTQRFKWLEVFHDQEAPWVCSNKREDIHKGGLAKRGCLIAFP